MLNLTDCLNERVRPAHETRPGAHLAGWDSILGIKQSAEYCEIGRKRLDFWSGNVGLFDSLTASDESSEDVEYQIGLEI